MNEELKLLLALQVQSLGASALSDIERGLRSIINTAGGLSGADAELMKIGQTAVMVGAGFSAASLAITAGMGLVTKAAADWQTQTTQIANNTNMTNAQMAQMQTTVQEMASRTSAPLDQLAQGYMHIANFGYDAAQATQILDAAQMSAVATGSDVAETANVLANVMHEFGINTSQAVQTMDQLHTAAALGNMTLQQFDASFGTVAAYASAIGVPLDQAAAAFSALTRHGLDAAEAGTQIRNLLEHLVNPSKQAREEIALLGQTSGVDLTQDFTQAGLASKGLTGVLQDIARATNGNAEAFAMLTGETAPTADQMDNLQRAASGDMQAMAKLIPALRGLFGEFILTGNGAADYLTILRQVDQATQGAGITNTTFQRSQETLNAQMGILRNNLQLMAIALGTAFLPAVNAFVASMVPVIQGITAWVSAHQQLIATVVPLVAGLLGILGTALAIAGAMAMVSAALSGLGITAGITGLAEGLASIAGAAVMAGSLGGLPAVLEAIGTGIVALLGPIGLVAAATVAFGTAYATNFAGVRDATDSTVSDVTTGYNSWIDLVNRLSLAIRSIPIPHVSLPSLPSVPGVSVPGISGLPSEAVDRFGQIARNAIIPVTALADAGTQLDQALRQVQGAAEVSAQGTEDATIAAAGLGDEYGRITTAAVETAPAQIAAANAAQRAADAARQQAQAQQEAANAARDLQTALSALGGVNALVTDLVNTDPAAQAAQARVDALSASVQGLQAAQEANSAATERAQATLQGLEDEQSRVNEQLSAAKQRLQELQTVQLTGMGAMDAQERSRQKQLEALQIRRDQLEMAGGSQTGRGARRNPALDAINQQIQRVQALMDIERNQRDLKYGDELKHLQEAAKGTTKELSFGDAMKQITDTKKTITDLTAESNNNKNAIDAQKGVVAQLEDAGKSLSIQIRVTNTDLSDAEKAHSRVADALKLVYDNSVKTIPELDKLGGVYTSVADEIDARTRVLVAATASYAKDQNATTLAALMQAEKDLSETQQRELALFTGYAQATLPPGARTNPATGESYSPGERRAAALAGFASGGSFDVGGSGGTDSQLVAFMATPGEHVTVGTGGAAGGGTSRILIEVSVDGGITVKGGAGASDEAMALGREFAGAFHSAVQSVTRGKVKSPNTARPLRPGAIG